MAKLDVAYQVEGTYATMAGVTMATSRLLGRTTASTGAAEEISVGSGLGLSAGVLSLGTAGVLQPANGGTGISSYTVGALVVATGAAALSQLVDVATGSVLVSGGIGVIPAWSATPTLTSLALTGAVGTYKNVATAGWGVPAIYASARSNAQTAAVASVATFTLGAADGDVIIASNVNVTTSVLHSFSVQVDYTDETNTAQTETLTFTQLNAASVSVITNGTGTGPYQGVVIMLRCKASTTVTAKTTGTFTSVTYNVGVTMVQLA